MQSKLLTKIWIHHKWPIVFVYAINIGQEICHVLIPAAIGKLINTFVYDEGYGLWYYLAAYIGWQGLGVFRRICDTKIFTKIYNHITLDLIADHKAKNIEVSIINARVELLKQVVSFFENDLPFFINSIVMMLGASVMLFFYNPTLMLLCFVIIIPSLTINYFFSKRLTSITQDVNNEYEKQIDFINTKSQEELVSYFSLVRKLNIKRSNMQAYNFGAIELFVLTMIASSIYIVCNQENISYGEIVAIYGYILQFGYSFDFIPHLTERYASIKDIQTRLETIE